MYIFGDNENQRLGVSDATKHIHIPRLINLPDPIETVHCGNYHTFFKAQNGTVYAVGSNELGQLGLPRSVIEVNNPTEISTDKLFEGHSIKRIACGASHTAFITGKLKLSFKVIKKNTIQIVCIVQIMDTCIRVATRLIKSYAWKNQISATTTWVQQIHL